MAGGRLSLARCGIRHVVWVAQDTRWTGEGLESPEDAARGDTGEVRSDEEGERSEKRGPRGIQHCTYHLQARADKLRLGVG